MSPKLGLKPASSALSLLLRTHFGNKCVGCGVCIVCCAFSKFMLFVSLYDVVFVCSVQRLAPKLQKQAAIVTKTPEG